MERSQVWALLTTGLAQTIPLIVKVIFFLFLQLAKKKIHFVANCCTFLNHNTWCCTLLTAPRGCPVPGLPVTYFSPSHDSYCSCLKDTTCTEASREQLLIQRQFNFQRPLQRSNTFSQHPSQKKMQNSNFTNCYQQKEKKMQVAKWLSQS